MTNQAVIQEVSQMSGTIIIKVPELLKERKQSTMDLMYGARLAPGTAYRLADGKADAITFDVLSSLCQFFDVGVGEILEYKENGTGKN